MTITRQKEKSALAQSETEGVSVNGHSHAEEPISLDGMIVSEEEYWANYYDGSDSSSDISYEWNNGVLEEKPLSDYRRVTMYGWFLMLLRAYLETNPIAKMLFLEVGFRLPLPHKTTIRKPDISVIRNDNPVPLNDTDMSYKGICDLCVESLSVSRKQEIERDTVVKKGEYAGAGVQEYFILDPDDRTAFYQRNRAGVYEPLEADDEGILRSNVLPGFQFRVADLFAMPTLEEMADDPVYRPFVLLQYQSVKERAAMAEDRAETAEERAQQAEERAAAEMARADRYAAILRELGITDN